LAVEHERLGLARGLDGVPVTRLDLDEDVRQRGLRLRVAVRPAGDQDGAPRLPAPVHRIEDPVAGLREVAVRVAIDVEARILLAAAEGDDEASSPPPPGSPAWKIA